MLAPVYIHTYIHVLWNNYCRCFIVSFSRIEYAVRRCVCSLFTGVTSISTLLCQRVQLLRSCEFSQYYYAASPADAYPIFFPQNAYSFKCYVQRITAGVRSVPTVRTHTVESLFIVTRAVECH